MNYRRRGYRGGSRPESGYLRNLRYEAPKEGLGKLLEKLSEWGGAVLGLAAGTAAAKQGLPVSAHLLGGVGVVLGAAVGAGAKAAVTAAFDTLKERRAARRARSGAASVGDIAGEIKRIIEAIDQNHQGQLRLLYTVRDNHGRLMMVLAGGRADLLQRINGQLSGARRAVEESCSLLRLSQDSLRGYLRAVGSHE
ncbi:hypothetical protein ABNF97_14870 [Plantactinospora sp. B6F1]|uniref:hypothetical protein n=1 Tax=Plantactinospora sp. B6F1 TaxID=3158971 RepID=UPI0032D9676D